jgi:acyl-CoA synthetase (AMP-forming)/AMP-acid ligase II
MGSVGTSTQQPLAENSHVGPADTKEPAATASKGEDDGVVPLRTVEDLMVARARAYPDRVILSYPSKGIEYVDYTMRQLDVFAYRAAVRYQEQLSDMRRVSSAEKPRVVAMLGPSNLEYLVTMLAMIKLGHTILFLSTRISPEAVESLMTTTGAEAIVFDARYVTTAEHVKGKMSQTRLVEMVSRPVFEFPIEAVGDTRLDGALDRDVETANTVYIIHSSGMSSL